VARTHNRGPWFGNDHRRTQFEQNARTLYPDITARADRGGVSGDVHYRVRLEIPRYGAREVHIRIPNFSEPGTAKVYVDDEQPSSRHRYSDGCLCMWHPDDCKAERWTSADGLAALLSLVERHLFREAWWNEKGEWPGPEAPHTPKEALAVVEGDSDE
jgi:hypothetical protein